jgi:hypothetical protein
MRLDLVVKHDTEGWKALETAVQTLYKMISGIGKPFCANMTPYLIELVLSFLSHKNRFVREIGSLVTDYSFGQVRSLADTPIQASEFVLLWRFFLSRPP